MKAKPFLHWVGGKTKLAPIIASHMPKEIGVYRDRFCGAGGMYFHMCNESRFKHSEISDKNLEIVCALRSIKFYPASVTNEVDLITANGVNRDLYEALRDKGFSGDAYSRVQDAARTIVLNKYGYNGLYRLNRSGKFNGPWGKRERVNINNESITESSFALQNTLITHRDALDPGIDLDLASGDVCYYDPPYIPVSKTASFTAYDGHPFTLDDQRRLATKAEAVASNGACVIISNSDTDDAREIFGKIPGVKTYQLSRAGTMNSNKSKRGRVSELLFVINGRKQ